MGRSPEEYAKYGADSLADKPEFYFPRFQELLNDCETLLKCDNLPMEEIDDILTIMALDNENEWVLDTIERVASDALVAQVVKSGIQHLQPNARWQVAKLAARRKAAHYHILQWICEKHK